MNILYLLLPLSFVLVTVLVGIVIWAIQNGQFDDLNGPAFRILGEDDD
ncbi:MAG: cbb3-type cytochrome oxidase assembly protein CcoS [Gammaproteobacteria bacterium]|nr:cbb3-type cytochrome oxidase assembly protein CcoS [Gammaproteobacteria bacterium]NKB65164.1 cbb3-type cytochrome oxidase assembly protein CcoS [Gammaproteobacteria bacterium]